MILVTGATGRIGTELIRLLSSAGVPTRALTRTHEKAAKITSDGVEPVVGDTAQPDSLRAALSGVEKVFLLTKEKEGQVELERNVITAAGRAGVSHIVKLSALGASLDSPLAEFRRHAEIEQHLMSSGIAFTHLRPNYFMQNLLMYVPAIRKGVLGIPMGTSRISMIDYRDIAAVAAAVLTQPGHENQVYELTGSDSLSFTEVASCFSNVLGHPVRYVDIPMETARAEWLELGLSASRVEALVAIHQECARGYGEHITTTVSELLGRPPRTLDAFAAEFIRIS